MLSRKLRYLDEAGLDVRRRIGVALHDEHAVLPTTNYLEKPRMQRTARSSNDCGVA